MNNIDCTIVVPVYFNEGSIERTYELLRSEVFNKCEYTFETIFIDDGSRDNSFEEILETKKQHLNDFIRVVRFTRNFGQIAAIRAGYEKAKGKAVVNIAADIQDPPELIVHMLRTHLEEGIEIVIAKRTGREESWFRKLTSRVFYSAMRKLSFPDMPVGGFDFVLLGPKIKGLILADDSAYPFWQGQILWPGMTKKFIPYKRMRREVGRSRWTFSKKVGYLLDGVINYSFVPIRFMITFGLLVSCMGFVYAIYIFLAKIFGSITIEGWAPLMIVVLILSGIQMLMLGVIGEYVWRNLAQSWKRSHFIVLDEYE